MNQRTVFTILFFGEKHDPILLIIIYYKKRS